MQNKINPLNSIYTAANIFTDLQAIRRTAPLIHNITNFVSMPFVANALLALGAAPVMAHAKEEIIDMTQRAKALMINIGTLDAHWIESMEIAMKTAAQFSIPIIFDPVGAGATSFRTEIARKFLQNYPLTIVRGNASEIMALHHNDIVTKGVDSTESVPNASKYATLLAQTFHCVMVVSGAKDFITNTSSHIWQHSGHSLMTKITGMGCVATAIIAAFTAVNNNFFTAATHAMAIMGIAGEIAIKKSAGPSTFQTQFIDCLYQLSLEDISQALRLTYA